MRHRGRLIAVAAAIAAVATACSVPAPPAIHPVKTQQFIDGVTVDDVTGLSRIVASLSHLPVRPWVRIPFDPGMRPADYRAAVRAIAKVAAIMAEPVDSSEVTGYTTRQYVARFRTYYQAFGTSIKLWEIGNEVNGDWLGPAKTVVQDIDGAYTVIHRAGGQTALTLSYEPGCAGGASHDMWTWATRNIPPAMKQGLNYVLVSYYEEDCGNYRPATAEWTKVFSRLHTMFPHARLGFGEVGTHPADSAGDKRATINRYYRMRIAVPGYIGGYFWWYYAEDMVPYKNNVLWHTLSSDMSS
jgi:hypothetical protein